MMRRNVLRRLRNFACAGAVVLVACGSPDGATGGPTSAATGSPSDDPAVQKEVGRISQQLGESSCATTAADVVRPVDDPQTESMGATYDHPTCRDGFIIDAPGLLATQTIYMDAIVPITTNVLVNYLACYLSVSWLYVYEKQGSTYQLVSQGSVFGSIQGQLPRSACHAAIDFKVPGDGDYKIVAAARQVFGAKLDVSVLIQATQ
jgi:hypothetical protein